MLQPLGLIVNLEPFHPKHFHQHPLNQVVAVKNLVGDVAPRAGKVDLTGFIHLNQAVSLEPPRRHGYRRS